jgi:cyclopropane-fatty-acyl-phospholipid synthase
VEGDLDFEGNMRDILRLGEALVADEHDVYRPRSQLWKWWRHSRSADRRNIQHHYDVGNAFYGLWLDRNRVYSCAYFKSLEDSLDTASGEQARPHLPQAHVAAWRALPGYRLRLGGLVIWAAQHYGVKALGVTLSDGQFEFATQRVRELGLSGQVEIRLQDYRDVPERDLFDKIASVGMFEHVGGAICRLLRQDQSAAQAGGLMMNHGITTNSLEDAELGGGIGEFVEEYVFPAESSFT